MTQEIFNVIISAMSVVVLGLASWAVTAFTNFLNAKIKDKQLAQCLTKVTLIVTDAVKSTYQEFVEVLKENGTFDLKAQEEAKRRAVEIINVQLTEEMKKFIEENFGDMQQWIGEKIESIIYTLKNQNKVEENV